MELLTENDVYEFFHWLSRQPKDYFGGEFLYDIKGHYKRLNISEAFKYWFENVKPK